MDGVCVELENIDHAGTYPEKMGDFNISGFGEWVCIEFGHVILQF